MTSTFSIGWSVTPKTHWTAPPGTATGGFPHFCLPLWHYHVNVRPGSFKPLKVYADTSVFGGVFDVEFQRHSMEFFREVHRGRLEICISPLLDLELGVAPELVWAGYVTHKKFATFIELTAEAETLQENYLAEGIVTPKSASDALHVALATVAGCEVIVSWNFKHIVHFEKVPLYNAVNRLNGYGEIKIHAPPEVIPND